MCFRSAETVASYFSDILAYGRNTGSVSMYMAHGGTSFAFWAGCNGEMFDITSYDYNCPISESGNTGQPGVGGRNKFQVTVHAPFTHLAISVTFFFLKVQNTRVFVLNQPHEAKNLGLLDKISFLAHMIASIFTLFQFSERSIRSFRAHRALHKSKSCVALYCSPC
jgi:hypothetical protein